MTNIIINKIEDYSYLSKYFEEKKLFKVMSIHGGAYEKLPIKLYLEKLCLEKKIDIVHFTNFVPNPTYASIIDGVELCRKNNIQCIIAVGGGSAIDVAKSIKAYCSMDESQPYYGQDIKKNSIELVAIPTTAGTGSEATHFAVIYRDGQKMSVAHNSLLPSLAILDENNLKTLPTYQRIVTAMDAMCHSIESIWSINATEQSVQLASDALSIIMHDMEGYIDNKAECNKKMLLAANLAGQAINIAKTTAAHAMSYMLSKELNIPHGHAVALCLAAIWENMLSRSEKNSYEKALIRIAEVMKCENTYKAFGKYKSIINKYLPPIDRIDNKKELLESLVDNVNIERLQNHPVSFDKMEIEEMYLSIFDRYIK